MCGFLGVITHDEPVAATMYDGLLCLQHRGQDAAGMATFDQSFHLKKGMGLVRDVFFPENLARLRGTMGIAHVRYPTIGAGGEEDAQPFLCPYPYGLAISHNGNLTNYKQLKEYLAERKTLLNSNCDVEALLNVQAISLARMGTPDLSPKLLFDSIRDVFKRVKGSYSAVTMVANYGLLAFRDPYGIKPAVWGRRKNSTGGYDYAVASENVALDIMGFTDVTDIQPGGAILFRVGEEPIIERCSEKIHHSPCIFEHVYFARPDSIIDQVSVYATRRRFGKKLAHKIKPLNLDIDVVIPVPDSACTSATTLASELGLKYREGFVKNRYIGRTFIMPDQQHRTASIRRKLNAIPIEFSGRNVLLVDDSIVRGNTSKKIVELARQAGAKKVYFASCSPGVKHPCVYGIDMATRAELVARNRSDEEIAKEINADLVVYQELEDLVSAAQVGNPKLKEFCTACFNGHYPTKDVTPEMLSDIEKERLFIRD